MQRASGTGFAPATIEGVLTEKGMKRILLIDDDLAFLSLVNSLLAKTYRFILAKSGEQALVIAAEIVPDLILLDVEMPGMNGFQTMTYLRAIPCCHRIPVIFLTANHDAETQVKALEAGGVDFIKKPFEKDILRYRLDLHLRLSQYQQGLENMLKSLEDSIVSAFSELVGCRDGHSGGHVQRTRKYVALLGGLLLKEGSFAGSLTEETLDMIIRAAPLHDIGKIGTSDIILLKPGRLSKKEYSTVKAHTVIGANALRSLYVKTPTQRYLEYAIRMAESHHERFDGQGYPQGLKGDAIPLCGRILALANVYDALTTSSVTRRELSHQEAVRIIAESSDGEFDPQVTAVFLVNNDLFLQLKNRMEEKLPDSIYSRFNGVFTFNGTRH